MAKAKPLPPLAYLREALDYDPDTGAFTWKVRPDSHFRSKAVRNSWNAKYSGRSAGAIGPRGYRQIMVLGVRVGAHRIAMYLETGDQPPIIDHIDGNPLNNRRDNLRGCTNQENLRNRKGRNSNNTSGIRGVYWYAPSQKWLAVARVDGKNKHLGYFQDKADAVAAAAAARAKYYGEFQGVEA